ncbi:MAG: hypothetical protein OES99_03770 [Gammaproteobacteria bacterium]|nr:hypothetical protein [Gammaproteobacteria bacterium]
MSRLHSAKSLAGAFCLTIFTLLAAEASLAAVDVDRVSSPVIYVDTGEGFEGMYAGYEIANNSGADIDDLWVGTENFSGTIISNGDNENGYVSLGALANGQIAYAFIYLKATGITTGETHDVAVYDGVPAALGGSGTQLTAAPTAPGGAGDGSGVQWSRGSVFAGRRHDHWCKCQQSRDYRCGSEPAGTWRCHDHHDHRCNRDDRLSRR